MSKAAASITTIRDLGRKVRRSPSTIHSYLADPEWRWGRGPWPESQLVEMNEWIARKSAQASKRNPALTAARVELLQAQLQLLNLWNGVAAGLYCTAAEVDQRIVETTVRMRQSMSDTGWRVRIVAGCGVEAMHEHVAAHIKQSFETYAKEIEQIPDATTAEADPIAIKRRRRDRAEGQGDASAGGAGAAGLHAAGAGAVRQGGTAGRNGVARGAHGPRRGVAARKTRAADRR